MNISRYPKAKRILVIGLSSISLFLVILYWILSCTLLNPAFYHSVFESGAAQASFADASGKISPQGTALFTGQSLKENALSLTEGILRFIKQNDMSLSNIQLEAESTQSIRTAVYAAAPEETAMLPELSRIHPFVISYFLPGSENIYSALFYAQKVYSALRLVIPMLLLILLLLLLLSKEPSENTKAVCISTGTAILSAAAIMLIFQRPLLLSPLSHIFHDADAMIPIVQQAVTVLVCFSALTGVMLFLPVPAVTLKPVKRFLNRFSRTFAILIMILTGLLFILFNNEVFAEAIQTVKAHAEQLPAKILSPGDGTVHSLTIKLREMDTQAPVDNVRLTLLRLGGQTEPVRITEYSDAQGNARFILPEGVFLLTADPASISGSFICFEPVVLTLDRPDSSWYTFYLARRDIEDFKPGIPEESNSRFPDRPVPLLK